MPEYYEIIPEFNAEGRLCNYHTGSEDGAVRVPADEWERFNQLAGRLHKIVEGVVVYDGALGVCEPGGLDIHGLREEKLSELSKACEAAITAGIDAGGKHYSLDVNDQINIGNLAAAAQAGQTVLYHADGELCEPYAPGEFLELAAAATLHKVYHTTYHNHAKAWALSCDNLAELAAIKYGSELPPDLAERLAALLGGGDVS